MSGRRAIADIRIGPRHRKELGGFGLLAKDLTPSERVAILETIVGNPDFGNRPRVANRETAAKSVGFGSRATAYHARRVVREGIPELVEAMDKGAIGIRPAAKLARLPGAEQRAAVVALPQRSVAESDAEHIPSRTERRRRERKLRRVTIPWSAVTAARILIERWPPSLVRDLIAALEQRLGDAQEAA